MTSQCRGVDKSLGLRRNWLRGNAHHEHRIPRRPGACQSLSGPSLFRHTDKPNRWLPPNPATASSHTQTLTLAPAKHSYHGSRNLHVRTIKKNRPSRQLHAVLRRHLHQSLRPNAVAVVLEIQALHLGTSAIDEHEQRTAQRIFSHHVLDHRAQPIIGISHIGGPAIQPHPHRRIGDPHQALRTRSTTPGPRVSSTSQRA